MTHQLHVHTTNKGVNLNLNLTAVHRALTDTKNIKKVNRYTLYSSLNEYIQCLVISTVLNGKTLSCRSEATYKVYIKDTPIPHVVVSPGQYLDFSASTTVGGCSVTIQNTCEERECLLAVISNDRVCK